MCVYYDKISDELKVGKLFSSEGPPIALTLHNALKIGNPDATCYVLRRQVMPVYDSTGVLIADNLTSDGRFSRKLHMRRENQKVQLHPCWKPGPTIPPPETFAGSTVS